MTFSSFRGGVHPPDCKAFSKDAPIETVAAPKKVRIPLAQHLGVPANPVVKKGDAVALGQVIGECRGFVSAAVHASVSGKVTAIDLAPHPSGRDVAAIEIESDGLDTRAPGVVPVADINRSSIVAAVQAAGIVGMGGAAFPSHVKLQPPAEKKISLLILNGAECEPFLTCDYRLMMEQGARVLRGAELLMTALGVGECIIAIEDNKPDAIQAMARLAASVKGVRVAGLKTHYPQGGEKQLIYALTKREVPSGGLPMDVGCVVHNVGTAAAVAAAVDEGMPLVERVVTVSGDAVARPGNYRVRIGMTAGELLAVAGVDLDQCAKVVMGGPMTGPAIANLDIPIMKGTSGILAFTAAWAREHEPVNCIRCGKCGSVCPIGLNPTMIEALSVRRNVPMLQVQHAQDCIECGCCSYACPAHRALVHAIKYAKAQIAALRKAKKN